MASHGKNETPIFDNNPTIAREIENEKAERNSTNGDSDETRTENQHAGAAGEKSGDQPGEYDKVEITEDDCFDELGYSYPAWKKWTILTVIFWVQVSMNFNTSLYSNAVGGISKEYGVSKQAARLGAALFLIFYAFGCELWAPWSEEFGRKPILQASLFLVNIMQIPVGVGPNFGTILAFRSLGGLSSAGGSVTLGMIADLFESDTQQYAVAYVVFSSVGGSVLGPIVGGFVEQYCAWRWNIWIQLIFGCAIQAIHFICVPETRSTILMDRIAKKRRKSGEAPNLYGPNELEPFKERFSFKEVIITWVRPFRMFLTEPIVLVLSLLSGFSDALIFMFIQSFSLVYKSWDFKPYEVGLAFCGIGVGYFIAWFTFIPVIKRNIRQRKENPEDERIQYESRLWWLLYTAPCLPIGLIIFAWTSTGPPLHWIGSLIASAIVGIANYSIYMATIDYMICAYGPYSASATGGNGWSRDFLAGILTLPATPFYQNLGKHTLAYGSTILFCISAVLVMAVYVIYWKGPALRARSPFAQQLADSKTDSEGRKLSYVPATEGRRASMASYGASQPRRQSYAMRDDMETRRRSAAASQRASAANTPAQSSAQVPTQRDFAEKATRTSGAQV